ncbi:MAG: hypothetical protein EXS51_04645 [Candidatus Taylorbacteria bacterium]|nr:hypothetical protein [Candidatus Taylorbacteria bacterium]
MKQEQLAQVPQEQVPEISESSEELSPEKITVLAESKETALDELKERSQQETTTFENSFAESAKGLGATPEEIAPVTGQIDQLEGQKEQVVKTAREQIEATAQVETASETQQPIATESVAPNTQEAANEIDPEAFAKAQEEKVRGVTEQLSNLSGEEAVAFVAEYNKNNPDSLKGQELRLMRADGEKMFVVNERGSLEEISVTKENAKEMLLGIKAKDELLKGKSYELRKAILERSEGGIVTHEAYTYGEVPQGNALDSFLDNPENWVTERRALHEQIVSEEYGKAAALSERLDDPEPTIYALRGNTAAGKTTAIRNNEIFSKALDAKGQPSGAINPDTYKGELKSTEAVEGRQTVGHQQTHEEGSMLARKISEKITKSESSMVIDKRMNKEKNITELIKTAEESGKKIKILDVDVPFEVSLVRVLGREIGGEDPTVPFGAVAEGFEGVRKNRASLLEQVANDPKIKDYVLMVADEKGSSVKVAEKIDGKLVILEGQEEAFQRAVDKGTESSVTEMAQTVIDDVYVAKIMDRTPESMQSKVRASLERYKGKTLKDALDEHSSKLNPE